MQERFDLADQMRRACKSVTSNIVEGYSHKDTPGKAKQLWRVAMGSANEMIEHLRTAVSLGYISREVGQMYIDEYTIVAKQLNRLIQVWTNDPQHPGLQGVEFIQHPTSKRIPWVSF